MNKLNAQAAPVVGLSQTINDVLARYPGALTVFRALKIHTCCGGGLTLDVAAANASVEPAVLLELLNTVASAGAVG
jgi:iron-sulfur cluster repair protein YtfE (RIC family)